MDKTWKPDTPGASSDKESGKLPLSHLAIPLDLSDDIRKHLHMEHCSSPPSTFRPEQHLLPATCSCGAGWKQYDEEYCVGSYYTVSFVSRVKVYYRQCCMKKCAWHFDGQSVGVFNYSGETLISYTLLREFFNCSVKNHMSWAGFLHKITSMYTDIYSLADSPFIPMSANTFSKVCKGLPCVGNWREHIPGCPGLLEAAIEINERVILWRMWEVPQSANNGWHRHETTHKPNKHIYYFNFEQMSELHSGICWKHSE